jgi:hypothetical protein
MLPLEQFIALGEAHYGAGMLSSLSVAQPGRVNARVEVRPLLGSSLELTKGEALAFNAITGELLRAPPPTRTSLLVQKVMAGLHFAQFGGYPMRWLYFICGLVSSAMIASGLVLYTVKRRRQSAAQGVWLRQVEWLNLACVGGLMLACVALLWANRLLPADLAEREGWELRVFFGAWLAALLHARLRALLRGWLEQLAASAVLLLGLPLLDLQTELAVPDRIRLGVDLTGFGLGALLALCLGTERHWKQLAAAAPPSLRAWCRPLGVLLLLLALLLSLQIWPASMALVGWLGMLSLCGLVLLLLLPYAPRLALAAC